MWDASDNAPEDVTRNSTNSDRQSMVAIHRIHRMHRGTPTGVK